MDPWELTPSGATAMVVAGVLTALVFWSSWASLFPRAVDGFDVGNDWHRRLIEFERDRVLSMAKGIGGAAAGFVVALVTSVVKNEIVANLSYTTFVGLVAGGIGAILLAWSMNASTRDFLAETGR